MPKFTGRYRMSFPRASTISGAVAVAILVIAATPASAQDARKLSKDELADFQTVHALVDAVASGKPDKDKKAAPAKAVVFTQPLTVPNLLSGLSTSSIILAKNIEQATGPQLSGQQQLDEPYTVSGYKITPSPVSSFSKAGELLW